MAVICVLGNLFLCYFFKYKYELSRGRRLKMTTCIKNSHFLFCTERLSITCWLVILTDYRVIICATSVFSQYWYCVISKVSKLALCGVSEGWKHFEKGSSWSSLVSGSAILSRWMWSASITLSCQSLQYFRPKCSTAHHSPNLKQHHWWEDGEYDWSHFLLSTFSCFCVRWLA